MASINIDSNINNEKELINDFKHDVNTDFRSDEIEDLDFNILFPPTSTRIQKISKKFTNDLNDKIQIEYIDLTKIPKKILDKLGKLKPSKEIEIIRDNSSESENSISDQDEFLEIQMNEEFEDFRIMDEVDQINKLKYNQDPTHFFSLTFTNNSKKLIDEFQALKKNVEDSFDYGEIKPNYFINEKKLHITLGLVRLETDEDFINCKNALSKLVDTDEFRKLVEISDKSKGFSIELEGLGHFGSVYKSRVIYAKLNDRIKISLLKCLWYKLCNLLIEEEVSITVSDHSTEKQLNILERIKESFKPHVTFINSKYGNSGNTKKTFDSSKLLKIYSKKYFGTGYVSEIQLNELSKYNGYEYLGSNEQVYKCIFSIEIK